MARGTAAGEPVVSQANTEEYRDNHKRIFGDRKPQRGRWVYDEALGKCVPAGEYQAPERAVDAPVLVDRFYEGTKSPIDGSDIGSRRKYREHMRQHGVTHMDDFKETWARAEEKRDRIRQGERMKIPGLRETIEREFYKIQKP